MRTEFAGTQVSLPRHLGVEDIARGALDDVPHASDGAQDGDEHPSNDAEPGSPEMGAGDLGLLHQQPEDGGQGVCGGAKSKGPNEAQQTAKEGDGDGYKRHDADVGRPVDEAGDKTVGNASLHQLILNHVVDWHCVHLHTPQQAISTLVPAGQQGVFESRCLFVHTTQLHR